VRVVKFGYSLPHNVSNVWHVIADFEDLAALQCLASSTGLNLLCGLIFQEIFEL
jgi:hypothetical protein